MNALFDIIASIGDAFSAVIDFIVSFFMDIVYVVQLIGSIILQIPSFFTWLPAELSTLIVLAITVASVYKIAGRD